jgi:predicted ATP-dependent endonuclease of OLD family
MKLSSVHITEFKSIRDSNDFKVGDVTCLVGKNEAGKTALLQALYRLNPVIPEHGNFSVTDDYPRADREDYQHGVEDEHNKPAIVVRAAFDLEPSDLQELAKDLGSNCLTQRTLTLSKGYENKLWFSLHIDEKAIVKTLVAAANLPTELQDAANLKSSVQELLQFLQSEADAKNNQRANAQAEANSIEDADKKAIALEQANKLGEHQNSDALRNRLVPLTASGVATYLWTTHLQKRVPKFLYFDEYYLMDGHLNIEALQSRQSNNQLVDSDRPMLGLIELARLKLADLLSASRTEELVNSLEGASNHLSKQVLKYWSQNRHLSVQFDVRPAKPNDPEGMTSGTNLWGRVFDSVHRVTTLLGTRSKGFVWFFSFLAWFSQQKKRKEPLILLLDEPGLFLHGRAQGDLLRYIAAELKPHHQVLYTTHSPFMVNPEHFDQVRIVQDLSMDATKPLPSDEEGTKVLSDVLEATEDSLFPLQGALGYDLAQTLFVGPCSLIVEGVSDLLYIQTISALLQASGKNGLSKKWTITPVGGADKVPTFVALLGAQRGLTVATLIDIQSKDQQRIENLYKQKLLKKKHVLTFGMFTGKPEADIEDMFVPDFYLDLVSKEYGVDPPIAAASLPSTTGPRILSQLEKYLETNPLPAKAAFNHYRPARYFAENIAALKASIDQATLDRFQAAFDALNALV